MGVLDLFLDLAAMSTPPGEERPVADRLLQELRGLGLDVDETGRARRPDGTVHAHVWTVGSLRKGAEWESTAVPELRLHAAAIAAALSPGP